MKKDRTPDPGLARMTAKEVPMDGRKRGEYLFHAKDGTYVVVNTLNRDEPCCVTVKDGKVYGRGEPYDWDQGAVAEWLGDKVP